MSIKSWHDSDDIDSDIECNVYNMLYYDNERDTKIDNVIENELLDSVNFTKRSISQNVTSLEEDVIIISDSEDSDFELRMTNLNKVSTFSIKSTSDDSCDSDNAQMFTKMIETVDSPFILNVKNVLSSTKSMIMKQKNDSPLIADWTVDEVDIKPRPKNRSRYFDDRITSVCDVCLKKGHSKSECTRSGPVCILCGKEGHVTKECDDLICYVCFQTDHITKKCPNSDKLFRTSCRRCGQKGHSSQICPDLWRQYKYTLAPGNPITESCSSQNQNSSYCANCSQTSHFTEQCLRNRMTSRFLGPPPIMEIVHFDTLDIYREAGLSYIKPSANCLENVVLRPTEEVDSMIMEMDVTGLAHEDELKMNLLVREKNVKMQLLTDQSHGGTSSISFESESRDFGDGYIMLSPIVQPSISENKRKSLVKLNPPSIQHSTPEPRMTVKSPITINEQLIDSTMPILPESLLRKLFPEETQNVLKLPPALRTKLRKRLKIFLKNGYLPGDSQMTQDRMDFWLQEISTGRSLSYRERKKLLGSVSAALHSISDRVSDVTTDVSRRVHVTVESERREQLEINVARVPPSVVTKVQGRRKTKRSLNESKRSKNNKAVKKIKQSPMKGEAISKEKSIKGKRKQKLKSVLKSTE